MTAGFVAEIAADRGKHLALCGKELTVAPLPLLSTQTSWILSEQE
jgi:hypothetical protein